MVRTTARDVIRDGTRMDVVRAIPSGDGWVAQPVARPTALAAQQVSTLGIQPVSALTAVQVTFPMQTQTPAQRVLLAGSRTCLESQLAARIAPQDIIRTAPQRLAAEAAPPDTMPMAAARVIPLVRPGWALKPAARSIAVAALGVNMPELTPPRSPGHPQRPAVPCVPTVSLGRFRRSTLRTARHVQLERPVLTLAL